MKKKRARKRKDVGAAGKVTTVSDLQRRLLAKGKTAAQLAAHMSVSSPTVHEWLHGDAMPKAKRIERLAQYFGVSTLEMTYLLRPNTVAPRELVTA